MKLRLLAMATVAAAALSTPALAGQGWYLGLGGGWDNQTGYRITSVPAPGSLNSKVSSSDDAIGAVSIGYAFDGGWRLENEFAFTQHSISLNGSGSFAASGGNQITSDMINLVYDIPLSDTVKFSIGGGLGIGGYRGSLRTTGTSFDIFRGGKSAFQWQAIAGLSVAVAPDVDLFGEYRYRENEADMALASSYVPLSPVKIGAIHENVAMFGLRWFLTPPPPPPAKTYIVFFDFDKSNLTSEAQATVTEAVSAAKTLGSVRIMVTGHTDTVGSDRYNQALSIRRATAVKDEMVRQGLGADAIAIEGKSFHDPLVPTGPGVREPKNRRAVIDLGG